VIDVSAIGHEYINKPVGSVLQSNISRLALSLPGRVGLGTQVTGAGIWSL
jgi:hypothetical protein